MPRRLICAALAVLFAGAACGYRFSSGGVGRDLHSGDRAATARRVEVRFFENRSAQPGFERMLADALVEEFSRRGELVPVFDGGAGAQDLILAGAIQSVRVHSSASSSVGLSLENRLTVRLDVSLRRAGGAIVWSHEQLDLEERYLSSADAGVRESNREQALRKLAAEVAGRIHDEITQTAFFEECCEQPTHGTNVWVHASADVHQ